MPEASPDAVVEAACLSVATCSSSAAIVSCAVASSFSAALSASGLRVEAELSEPAGIVHAFLANLDRPAAPPFKRWSSSLELVSSYRTSRGVLNPSALGNRAKAYPRERLWYHQSPSSREALASAIYRTQ